MICVKRKPNEYMFIMESPLIPNGADVSRVDGCLGKYKYKGQYTSPKKEGASVKYNYRRKIISPKADMAVLYCTGLAEMGIEGLCCVIR